MPSPPIREDPNLAGGLPAINLLRKLTQFIRYAIAGFFIQIAAMFGFLVGGTVWASTGSLWAGAGTLFLVFLTSLPVYAALGEPAKTLNPSKTK